MHHQIKIFESKRLLISLTHNQLLCRWCSKQTPHIQCLTQSKLAEKVSSTAAIFHIHVHVKKKRIKSCVLTGKFTKYLSNWHASRIRPAMTAICGNNTIILVNGSFHSNTTCFLKENCSNTLANITLACGHLTIMDTPTIQVQELLIP